MENRISYGEDNYQGQGKHRQEVFCDGKRVGLLITQERNPLIPLEEYYMFPDVNEDDEWCKFTDEKEAFKYIEENFNILTNLMK